MCTFNQWIWVIVGVSLLEGGVATGAGAKVLGRHFESKFRPTFSKFDIKMAEDEYPTREAFMERVNEALDKKKNAAVSDIITPERFEVLKQEVKAAGLKKGQGQDHDRQKAACTVFCRQRWRSRKTHKAPQAWTNPNAVLHDIRRTV